MGNEKSGKPLSERERARVRELSKQGLTAQQIGAVLGRTLKPITAILRGDYLVGSQFLTIAERDRFAELSAQGFGFDRIATMTGRSGNAVRRSLGLGVAPEWQPAPGRLLLAERETLMVGLGAGRSLRSIAAELGRHASTISREVARNGGRHDYAAWRAHGAARHHARRPKTTKLMACPALAKVVIEWLEQLWSPTQIAGRLRDEFATDPLMRVSHETIYQSLYVQGRGALRKELASCLRSGRAVRRHQGRLETRGQIPGKVMISERPAEVSDRAVPGHWEGDLIVGKDGGSAVGTLVERSTRYTMLLHLPNGYGALNVNDSMRRAIAELPKELFSTITWDQGKEMSRHAAFTIETGIPIYFCDPHSPWQRGTNENTNGLLRQYMPKGTDLSKHSAADLAAFAASLNNRPRKTLDFRKPSERLALLLQ